MTNSNQKIVFLLGAGASVDAGLPTTEQLFSKFEASLRRAPGLTSAAHRMLRRLRDSLDESRGRVDFETLVHLLYLLRDRTLGPVACLVKRWKPWVFRKDTELVARAILAQLRSFLPYELGPISDANYLIPLLEIERNVQLDIFTLNYDVALEVAAEVAKVGYTTGFVGSDQDPCGKGWWHPEEFDRTDVCIYKLHGSLRWVTENTSSSTEMRELSLPKFYDTLAAIRKMPAEFQGYTSQPEEFFFPPFIFGTPSKLHPAAPFSWLFARFGDKLRRAGAVIVIGYGWQDSHVNHLLIEGAQNGLSIVNVDPRGFSPSIVVAETGFPAHILSIPLTAAAFLLDRPCEVEEVGGWPDPWKTVRLPLKVGAMSQVLQRLRSNEIPAELSGF